MGLPRPVHYLPWYHSTARIDVFVNGKIIRSHHQLDAHTSGNLRRLLNGWIPHALSAFSDIQHSMGVAPTATWMRPIGKALPSSHTSCEPAFAPSADEEPSQCDRSIATAER